MNWNRKRISKKWKTALLIIVLFSISQLNVLSQAGQDTDKQIYLADPAIFRSDKTYYLYGTVEGNAGSGFKVYTSTDQKNWQDKGYALKKGEAFGNGGFWAPQVFSYKKKYYMAYVADEQIAIAESNSPLGPFVQKEMRALKASVKQIDPFVYFDNDGKIYLYHVRLAKGNRLFVAELNEELTDIKPETLKECISAAEPWENTANAEWPVAEGPTVMKQNGLYYLFYTANDFRNPDYAVGYATSTSPYGPWQKYEGNPILSRKNIGQNGTGHGDFFRDADGKLNYVFHTHNSAEKVAKRRTAVIQFHMLKKQGKTAVFEPERNTFHYLEVTDN